MNYEWLITEDWTNGDRRTVNIVGPAGAALTMSEILRNSQARAFRMLDDDGNLYYKGYYVGPEDGNLFAPLDDYGAPNAGCTSIEYFDIYTGEWSLI